MSDTAALVDAHHHVWDLAHRPQPWLDEPGHEPIRRTFGTDDLRSAATRPVAGRSLGSTVVVQCITSVPETRELLALAERDPLIGAVVGWADLSSPSIGDVLDELRAGPGGGHLRAVRHLVQGEPDPGWLQQPSVERGLRAVGERGLAYDVLIRSHQFGQAVQLAERFPDLPLVLDHAGKPPIAGGEPGDWKRGLRRLAAHPQVRCKVSGLVTEADPRGWTIDDIRPVWDVLLSAFGPDRLMFGSDWPVCVLAGGWNRWAATVEELLDGCSATETSAVLADTATAFYQLNSPAPKNP
ncbi:MULTISPECIES: amidohydrolase family protein [Streptomyces]|uniref:Amidohydrolase-related domain-containing protein n=1 Tax=Streptomyces scabiei (strain 87.22) TaxID=680198 RepID=C9YX64_STRSW|nr:amidohydrolase family protein [Streptomyces scabiei]MBP5926869.1 amidohydrolase family protein [Streptomyces sp. LBUM 1479]KFG03117.1 amidohydrolase [Streptomyces scabiei]MDX2578844.1 amidohydrolase family protein [Streptomyces scabiei]MDX2654220.1 amidohydrolase family protein [Streptomyces scabiei]MDX2722614.1 amidohydrolase family protein [Streptomyces scabiei]